MDPNYVSGDLLNGGALINEMPLFRISLDGLAVQEPVPLFSKYLLRGDQIADNAITTEKIANGTITASDLSSDLAGRITDLEAAWDSVSPLIKTVSVATTFIGLPGREGASRVVAINAPNGYEPVAIAGWDNSSYEVSVTRLCIADGALRFAVFNGYSAAMSPSVTALVICLRSVVIG